MSAPTGAPKSPSPSPLTVRTSQLSIADAHSAGAADGALSPVATNGGADALPPLVGADGADGGAVSRSESHAAGYATDDEGANPGLRAEVNRLSSQVAALQEGLIAANRGNEGLQHALGCMDAGHARQNDQVMERVEGGLSIMGKHAGRMEAGLQGLHGQMSGFGATLGQMEGHHAREADSVNPAPSHEVVLKRGKSTDKFIREKAEITGLRVAIKAKEKNIKALDQNIGEMGRLNSKLNSLERTLAKGKDSSGIGHMGEAEKAKLTSQIEAKKEQMHALMLESRELIPVNPGAPAEPEVGHEGTLVGALNNLRNAQNDLLTNDKAEKTEREGSLNDINPADITPREAKTQEAAAFGRCLDSIIDDKNTASASLTDLYKGLAPHLDDASGRLELADKAKAVFFNENGTLTEFGIEYNDLLIEMNDLKTKKYDGAQSGVDQHKKTLKNLDEQMFYKVRSEIAPLRFDNDTTNNLSLNSHAVLGFMAKSSIGLDLDDQGLSFSDLGLKSSTTSGKEHIKDSGELCKKTFNATTKNLTKFITAPVMKTLTVIIKWPVIVILTLISMFTGGYFTNNYAIRNGANFAERKIINIGAAAFGMVGGAVVGTAAAVTSLFIKAVHGACRFIATDGAPYISQKASAFYDGSRTFYNFCGQVKDEVKTAVIAGAAAFVAGCKKWGPIALAFAINCIKDAYNGTLKFASVAHSKVMGNKIRSATAFIVTGSVMTHFAVALGVALTGYVGIAIGGILLILYMKNNFLPETVRNITINHDKTLAELAGESYVENSVTTLGKIKR